MKFPLSWLSSFITLSVPIDDLVNQLTMAGLEVEDVTYVGKSIKGIITGKITDIKPHPNADKLVITQVFDGTKKHQIVTGATNIEIGDVVPASLPGAVLANGLKIKESSLRGIASNGMLCSEEECGIEKEAEGIWILPKDTPLGLDFVDYATLSDIVLDVAILPNRADCQSILGLAREISALLNVEFKLPNISLTETSIHNPYTIKSLTNDCPYYIGRYITNATNGESPLWLARRLQLSGIRPISLLVDITNYVLLETGQPLHAFDDRFCKNKSITIQYANKNMSIQTLDDIKRTVTKHQLLVCDDNEPIAIAGIMGAKNSQVLPDTTNIFLESAFFQSTSIRRSTKELGLKTDSAIRFEKGAIPFIVDYASKRAAELYQQLAGAKVSSDIKEFKQESHTCFQEKTLPFSLEKINSFLGSTYTLKQVTDVLTNLGFIIQENSILVPQWRQHDIEHMPCIAEEIVRCIGFDSIVASNVQPIILNDRDDPIVDLISTTQQFFVANGFNEINTYPMISKNDMKALNHTVDVYNELANPISDELSVMRSSLLPSFCKLVGYHTNRQMPEGAYFEIGKTYEEDNEETWLAFAITQSFFTQTSTKEQDTCSTQLFQHAQHILLRWFKHHRVSIDFIDSPKPPHIAHPHFYQILKAGNLELGYILTCHPSFCDQYNIDVPMIYAQVSLDLFLNLIYPTISYTPFSRFPSTRRDIALVVPNNYSFSDIREFIAKFKHKSVVDMGVFDVYQSKELGDNKKSIGIYLIYQDISKTLSDEKVNNIHDRLCKRLVNDLPVTIR